MTEWNERVAPVTPPGREPDPMVAAAKGVFGGERHAG
jgi:hypothetical protein